jgi:hypothetical protein
VTVYVILPFEAVDDAVKAKRLIHVAMGLAGVVARPQGELAAALEEACGTKGAGEV